MTLCPRCSGSVPAAARFCPECGEAVSSASQLPTNLATPSVAEAARRRSPSSSAPVGRLASSDAIGAGGFTPGAILAERYRVIGLLGRGGMGEVYRADDLKLGQPVALKFLPRHLAGQGDRLERFYAEVRIARQVSHPNVCRVYDVGEIDGQQYLSMEFVDGEDLASLLKRIGRLPGDKALDIARELCAGLAAAHDKGVLHRDLKPANVMIDGRGRARITDFGLAVAAGEAAGGEISGTPTYMAPEQLAGKGASVRSDVYALGLVLYELYTGRKAFDGASLEELARKHAEEAPTSPSTISPGFDPVVERVILRCLEKDPAARPASVTQVAVALPGGDPLAAALAAGETPSPEMVAAAGEQGALAPAKAWTLLSVTLVLVAGVLVLARYGMDQGVASLPKSPDTLEDRARELVKAFGYTAPPADSAVWWERQYDLMRYRATHIPSVRDREELPRAEPHPWWFSYRQSPRDLVPLSGGALAGPARGADVGANNPPFEVSGMVHVELDARGNLVRFHAVPPQVEASGAEGAVPAPDWKPLFAAAGLDPARFTSSAPGWLPAEPFDVRADWDGSYSSGPGLPIHVSAASRRGRPVSFEITGPWSRPERMQESPTPSGLVAQQFAFLFLFLSVLVAGGLVARRNLRLGRGDRRGAFRVSAFVFSLEMLAWLFRSHHLADSQVELNLFVAALSNGLFTGGMAWLIYAAIEPIVRRRWPDLLFSWSRLLAGRVRDPLVGRDVLVGLLVGSGMSLTIVASNALPYWANVPGVTTVPPASRFLLDLPAMAATFFGILLDATMRGLAIMTLLVLGQVLLRRKWLAVGLTGLVLLALTLSGENYAVELPTGILFATLAIFVAVRYGILALAAAFLAMILLSVAPLTLDVSLWYAGRGLFLAGVVVALAVYAFRVALGGKAAFTHGGLDD